MKKKIYLNKIDNVMSNNIIDKSTILEKKSFRERVLLGLKSFGLIFMLLFGPSFFVIFLFGNNYSNFSLTSRAIVSLVANLLILIILYICYRDTLKRDFKNFFNKNIFNNLEIAFKYWLGGFLIMIISNLIITFITNGGMAANEESIREMIDLVPLYMIFNVSIYAPFTEELIFRKSIRDFIFNKWIYILISGIIFGALHIITNDITNYTDLLFLIPYCALGISFSALYTKTNNIYSSISMHMLHNSIAILLYLI